MMSQVLMMMSISIVFTMPIMKSLILMGLSLFMLALLSAFTLLTSSGSWFCFLMFLIYITGLLVLIGYFLVVNPNNNSIKSSSDMIIFIVTMVLLSLTSYFNVTLPDNSTKNYKNSFTNNVVNIYENDNMPIYMFMVSLLFFALVLAVYLSYKTPKPMRSFLG